MKHSILTTTAATLLLACPALAEGGAAHASDFTSDWSGFYAGGMVSFSLESEYLYYALDAFADSGNLAPNTAAGAFAGYNFQRGAFVYGGEFAVDAGGIDSPGTDLKYGPIIDVKARAGYAFGKALAYGVVGGSFATFDVPTNLPPYQSFSGGGFVYGVGLDYQINEQLFVGIEYLVRDLDGTTDADATFEVTSKIQSAQLRAGWKFYHTRRHSLNI